MWPEAESPAPWGSRKAWLVGAKRLCNALAGDGDGSHGACPRPRHQLWGGCCKSALNVAVVAYEPSASDILLYLRRGISPAVSYGRMLCVPGEVCRVAVALRNVVFVKLSTFVCLKMYTPQKK